MPVKTSSSTASPRQTSSVRTCATSCLALSACSGISTRPSAWRSCRASIPRTEPTGSPPSGWATGWESRATPARSTRPCCTNGSWPRPAAPPASTPSLRLTSPPATSRCSRPSSSRSRPSRHRSSTNSMRTPTPTSSRPCPARAASAQPDSSPRSATAVPSSQPPNR